MGSVCSYYVHYTGFPSALQSPWFLTFSHLHLRFAILSTFPTSCTHWRLKKKICRALFQSFQNRKKDICHMQRHGFPSLQGPGRTQSKTYSASLCCGMHNTTWNPQRGIWQSGMWIPLNTSSCKGMWPRAAPSITVTVSGIRTKGIWKSQLWTFLYLFLGCSS